MLTTTNTISYIVIIAVSAIISYTIININILFNTIHAPVAHGGERRMAVIWPPMFSFQNKDHPNNVKNNLTTGYYEFNIGTEETRIVSCCLCYRKPRKRRVVMISSFLILITGYTLSSFASVSPTSTSLTYSLISSSLRDVPIPMFSIIVSCFLFALSTTELTKTFWRSVC